RQPKDVDGDGVADPLPGCANPPWGWTQGQGGGQGQGNAGVNGQGQGPCGNNGQGGPEVRERDLYFYHPDHLGASSYVTDADGGIFQFTLAGSFRASKVATLEGKKRELDAFIERLWPGRNACLRSMKPQELKATTILQMKIDEGSMKLRDGSPEDESEDYLLPTWVGVIPIRTVADLPQPDPGDTSGVSVPEHIHAFCWPILR
ncbi:MAG: hypothetical protein AAF982_00895, partial [Pseudomonadota bacterium]